MARRVRDVRVAAGNTVTPLLDIQDVVVRIGRDTEAIDVLRGVSLDVDPGETVGIVGESGSGKSMTSLAAMGMLPRGARASGQIVFDDVDLLTLTPSEMRRRRGCDLGMIFQDPNTSLNPVVRVGTQMTEALCAHQKLSRDGAARAAAELLDRVGVPDASRVMRSHPHRLSGGMCQRVMIAMTLAMRPRLLIADEPTTALDVTIQAQVLETIRELTREFGTAVVLVTHDLGVVAAMSHRVNVMYAGEIVETGPTATLLKAPRHPYTIGLLRSVPRAGADAGTPLIPIPGHPVDLAARPPGCAFAPRCVRKLDVCDRISPPWMMADGHGFLCHNPEPARLSERDCVGPNAAGLEAT